MQLSPTLSIDSVDYAVQGNAILGIRESGKSYTATYIAEQLMEEGIPFIAFDPIGIWRYLKVGKNGAGYPVVVAGDNGDLPLTPKSAPDIVRAAMKENISLVVDLYSMKLSKADWRSIVEHSIKLLLYENMSCGLRHIFIEEAAEFCPQKGIGEGGRVYAEVEKLARMGGNASLGYTLINQRPEEVNKAVLELCDCLFLHRQKGRHSIAATEKWLEMTSTNNVDEIITSLPSLPQGECWVWPQGSHDPLRIKVPEKKTVHPNRKNPQATTKGIKSDVSKFVARLNEQLITEGPVEGNIKSRKPVVADQSKKVQQLIDLNDAQRHSIENLERIVQQQDEVLQKILNLIVNQPSRVPEKTHAPRMPPAHEKKNLEDGQIKKLAARTVSSQPPAPSSNGSVQSGPLKYLKAAAMFYPGAISKRRMCALCGVSPKKSTHRGYMAYLKQNDLLEDAGDGCYRATKKGMKVAGPVDSPPANDKELIDFWCNILGGGAAIYLRLLAKAYPHYVSKTTLAAAAGTDTSKSTHRGYMGTLNSMGLIETKADAAKISDEIFN